MAGIPERSKRSLGAPWIEVPQLLDFDEFKRLGSELRAAGLTYDSEPITVGVSKYTQDVEYDLFLRRDQAEAAAKILRQVLELEDPDDDRPFTGSCPACKVKVTEAWSCPSCDLSFRSPFERDDPMIAFVREYGGFRET